MPKIKFEYGENPETGEFGFKMLGKRHFDYLAGMTCAHDVLEHFPDDNGSVEHEAKALGACLYIRRDFWLSTGHYIQDPIEHVSSDIVSLFHLDPIMTKCPYTVKDIEKEFDVFRLNERLRKIIRDNVFEVSEKNINKSQEYANLTSEWIQYGYRKCQRRYRNVRRDDLLDLFKQIMNLFNGLLAHKDDEDLFEGEIITLNYSVSRKFASLQRQEEYA